MNGEPGNTLRRIREERAYSQEEVAEKLHLSVGKVIALESCDYPSLPEATYVRGYIRNYAQLLEIDPVPLVAAYDDQLVKKKKERHQTELAIETSRQSASVARDNQTIMVIAGVVIVVAIGLGFWLYSASEGPADKVTKQVRQDDSQRYESTVMEDNVPAQGESLNLPQGDVNDPLVAGALADAADGAGAGVSQQNAQPENETSLESGAAENSSLAGKAVQPGTPSVAAVDPVRTQPQESETVKAQEQATANGAAAVLDELVLIFEMDSWADVRDANDRKLLYKTVSAGRVVSMKGLAPFQVFIGNADGVKLSLNGQQIDFTPYRRGLIARFTVGRKSGQSLNQ